MRVILVTENGVENLSVFVPSSIEAIEKTLEEKGMIEFRPPRVSTYFG